MEKNKPEINEAYVKKFFGAKVFAELPQKNIDAAIATMKKYDHAWWESKDPVEVARYQVFEPIILNGHLYRKGLEKLIGRGIYCHELGLNREALMQEAREAIERIEGRGKPLDARVIAERTYQGLKSLTDFCGKKGIPVLHVR